MKQIRVKIVVLCLKPGDYQLTVWHKSNANKKDGYHIRNVRQFLQSA